MTDNRVLSGLANSPAAGKNLIINGAMEFWQRGTSFALTSPSTAYTADRWLGRHFGTNVTYSQQTSGLTGFQYSMRVQRPNGLTGTNDMFIYYIAETSDSYRFAGKTATLSFWAKAGSNYSASSSVFYADIYSGTGTNQNITAGALTGQVTVAQLRPTLTNSWQRFSVTGTFNTNISQISLIFGFTPIGTAGANDWFEITGVQLEVGSAATEFSRSGGTIQQELAACQRYYYRMSEGNTYGCFATGAARNTTVVYAFMPLPVTMRVAPTSMDISTISVEDYSGTTWNSGTFTLESGGQQKNMAWIRYTHGSAVFTQYRPAFLSVIGSSSGYIGFNAEL